jgi:hypothetical protein
MPHVRSLRVHASLKRPPAGPTRAQGVRGRRGVCQRAHDPAADAAAERGRPSGASPRGWAEGMGGCTEHMAARAGACGIKPRACIAGLPAPCTHSEGGGATRERARRLVLCANAALPPPAPRARAAAASSSPGKAAVCASTARQFECVNLQPIAWHWARWADAHKALKGASNPRSCAHEHSWPPARPVLTPSRRHQAGSRLRPRPRPARRSQVASAKRRLGAQKIGVGSGSTAGEGRGRPGRLAPWPPLPSTCGLGAVLALLLGRTGSTA